MIRQLHDNPIEVFFHFQRQSGLTLPLPLPDHLDIAALEQGLRWLATWDSRNHLSNWSGPLLAIASHNDQVVTPQMSQAQFAALSPNPLHWLTDGGHLLPLTRPEQCAALVAGFIQNHVP
ncbi:MAG: alpha/beta hydrolase [Magnetococcales bacterium]|nr:alpha/beta hydrolase [Magnetococcales bacterium]